MKSSKKIYQMMSLLIAVSLWIYVVAEENIFQERTFTADVQYVKLEENLIPSAKMPTVNISIRGDQITINNFKVSDFSVFVDLESAQKGESEFSVQVNAPAGVRVVSVSPEKIYLRIDEKAEKQVPLRVNVSGKAKEGFTAFEPNLKTSHVTVSGPSEMLQEISFAEADVNIDNADSNLSLKLIPRIRGAGGNVDADIIEIKPELVDIFVPVIEDNPSKSVPVAVPVTGIPAYGYKVSRIVVEPEIVRISGSNEIIETIREIRTQPVDVTNHKDEILRETDLFVPENITSLYDDKIKVVVLFEKIVVEKRVEKQLEIRNVPDGVTLKSNQQIISVVLKGDDLEFRDFLLENLHLYVDAEKFTGTSQEYEVKVEKPANIDVVEITPSRVTITKEN